MYPGGPHPLSIYPVTVHLLSWLRGRSLPITVRRLPVTFVRYVFIDYVAVLQGYLWYSIGMSGNNTDISRGWVEVITRHVLFCYNRKRVLLAGSRGSGILADMLTKEFMFYYLESCTCIHTGRVRKAWESICIVSLPRLVEVANRCGFLAI